MSQQSADKISSNWSHGEEGRESKLESKLQSLATSDGSWPDKLLPCPPSPPSDSSAAPSLVASSEDDDDWGSPPSSPRVTPALVARLSAWIASSNQLPTT